MGVFNSIGRALGSLGALSDHELEVQREALRQQYVSSGSNIVKADRLYNELHRYDEEMIRRANRAYERENPNPPEPRHREHGWYLPNDD